MMEEKPFENELPDSEKPYAEQDALPENESEGVEPELIPEAPDAGEDACLPETGTDDRKEDASPANDESLTDGASPANGEFLTDDDPSGDAFEEAQSDADDAGGAYPETEDASRVSRLSEEAESPAEPNKAKETKEKNARSGAVIALAVVSAILAVATIVLFVLVFSMRKNEPVNAPSGVQSGETAEKTDKNGNQDKTDRPDGQTPENGGEQTGEKVEQPTIPLYNPDALNNESPVVRVAAACSPSVVTVRITTSMGSGSGSGVVWSSDGYIVTNNHVVEDAVSVKVVFSDGKTYSATVINTNPDNDLALLRINASGLYPVTPGNSDDLLVGELAVVIGNPLGTLANTVTEGIVSALARDITIDGTTYHVLQTSAAINSGNSGGGCFNSKGELIGIVNSKKISTATAVDVEGLGFAIPVNTVKKVIAEMVENDHSVLKKSLGITSCYEITEDNYSSYSSSYLSRLEQLHGSPLYGVYIYGDGLVSYAEGSNTFEAGDVLISIDGKEVRTLKEVDEIIQSKNEGDVLTLKVYRLISQGYWSSRYTLEQAEISCKVVLMYR